MAARINKRQADSTRQTIQTQKICKALQDHIDGTVEMKATQINAARILLDKSLPSLTATAVSSDDPMSMPILTIVPSNAA